MVFDKSLQQALPDYRFLMDRGYPARGAIKLVSNRYGLNGRQRSMLYRGVVKKNVADSRKNKLLTELVPGHFPLIVDGFNVLVTISSYLQGLPVFVACDGLLRDASRRRGEIHERNKLPEATRLLAIFLSEKKFNNCVFYFDAQVSFHQQVVTSTKTALVSQNLVCSFIVSDEVDKILGMKEKGCICTSDSEIIDRSSLPVYDLARKLLSYFFSPDFVDLGLL